MAFYNWQYFFSFLVIHKILLSWIRWNTVFHFLSQHILERLCGIILHCIVFYISGSLSVCETISTHKARIYVCWMNRCALFTITWMTSAHIFILERGGGMGKPSQCGFSWGSSQGGEDYPFLQGCWGPGDGWGGLESVTEVLLPCGWHSLGLEKSQRIHLVLNPWSAKQTSMITSFLLGKYDLLFKDLIYSPVFRSTLWPEAVHPILPSCSKPLLWITTVSLFICFFLMKSVIPSAPPTWLYIILNNKGQRKDGI